MVRRMGRGLGGRTRGENIVHMWISEADIRLRKKEVKILDKDQGIPVQSEES